MNYRVVDTTSRGKIVVATKDFLPGELIVREAQPFFHVSGEFLQKCSEDKVSLNDALFTASFCSFKKNLSPVDQETVVSLFGPTTGAYADAMRRRAKLFLYEDPDEGQHRHLTTLEVEEYVKVSSVLRMNAFGSEDGGRSIFLQLTRFAHSCSANCRYSANGSSCSCYAIQLIKSGEELTFSYNTARDSLPIHERRYQYLDNKEFTCHCPRCDAEGDDTRQFDCCDSACCGVMMVYQPINMRKLTTPGLSYTGVEYVDPHLLPCTVCQASASVEYQTAMFALEDQLISLGDAFITRFRAFRNGKSEQFESLLQEIEATHFPRRHLKSLNILWTVMAITQQLCKSSAVNNDLVEFSRRQADLQRAAKEYMAAQEGVFPHPCYFTYSVLKFTCDRCILNWHYLPPLYSAEETKELLQRTVRMQLTLSGRLERTAALDDRLLSSLKALPTPVTLLEECAFCEESPLRAALTLSYCNRCRQVAYCSVGCQKAHWKLHKKTCKKR